ncbi:MAG: InlB B-repeat-containing protein [Clostridia bacterium]|nr:InlB B-repeat-containing protein [Clostridia bacterium]
MKKILIAILLLTMMIHLIACDSSQADSDAASGIDKPLVPNYTVKFETNGGSAVAAKSLNVLEKAPTTTKKDYLFDGWYRDKSLTTAAVFPLELEGDTVLYAKWLQLKGQTTCKKTSIKMWEGSNSLTSYTITPNGFDYESLKKYGYVGINVTVTYEVKYRKDYDALWDIGYAGSPEYEVMLLNSDGVGEIKEGLGTSKSYTERTISCGFRFEQLENGAICLTFSTDNIQNTVFIDNIVVAYVCAK